MFLDGFASDGGCAEGVVYWAYGFGYFTYAADLLERAQKALVGLGVPTDGEVAVSGTWGSATVTGAGQGSTVNVVVNRGVPG